MIPGDSSGTTSRYMQPCGRAPIPDTEFGCFITATRTTLTEGNFAVPGDSSGTTSRYVQPCGPIPQPQMQQRSVQSAPNVTFTAMLVLVG